MATGLYICFEHDRFRRDVLNEAIITCHLIVWEPATTLGLLLLCEVRLVHDLGRLVVGSRHDIVLEIKNVPQNERGYIGPK